MLYQSDNYGLNNSFSFYRDKDGYEIDLVVKDFDNFYHPYEIKYRSNADISMISSFNKLESLNMISAGGIICNALELKHITAKNQIIPIGSMIS